MPHSRNRLISMLSHLRCCRRSRRSPGPGEFLALLLLILPSISCENETPVGPPEEPVSLSREVSSELFLSQEEAFPFPAGHWVWTCHFTTLDSTLTSFPPMVAYLTTGQKDRSIYWDWRFPNFTDQGVQGNLIPDNPEIWHSMEVQIPSWASAGILPLPVMEIDSLLKPHLLDLMKELTLPWFNQVVTHWPELPIPVRLGSAISGNVDLSRCLGEAIEIWNQGRNEPWFLIEEEADWGVRLIHFPDITLVPALEARITRLAATGSPLRMNIVAGNNYEQLRYPKYVVRGFVHELGHALFLWGHSPDRNHCLWGAAPPIVDHPSQDERKAARLWHGLPEGLDLSKYH